MQLLTQWIGVSKYMLTSPGTFFEHYDEDHGVGYPLAFLAVSVAVVLLPFLLFSVVGNATDPTAIPGALLGALLIAVVMWVWTILEATITHVLLLLFGASDYGQSLEAYAFPAVIRYAVWWFPLVNILFVFVGLYLQARGLSQFHDLSDTAAAFAVILAAVTPIVLLVLLTVVAAFVFNIQTPGPQPPVASLPL